jgi:hypothetical protein
LRKRSREKTKGLSPQARELIELFEKAPGRGGYCGKEITRAFIHERDNVF